MFEAVAGERRMIGFDVDLHLILEPVALEETVYGPDVAVVLVLGRLVRFGLDQDGAVEADLILVLDNIAEKAAELIELMTEVRVEDRVIAFAPTPQNVIGAAEAMRGFEHFA